jgi:hypothetical protein
MKWVAARAAVKNVRVEQDDFTRQSVAFLVDDGRKSRLYRECPYHVTEQVFVERGMVKGEEIVVNFRPAGRGRCDVGLQPSDRRASFSGAESVHSSSRLCGFGPGHHNDVECAEVRGWRTSPADRELLDRVRWEPRILRVDGGQEAQLLARSLLQKHPRSRYLRWAQLELMKQRSNDLHNRFPTRASRYSSSKTTSWTTSVPSITAGSPKTSSIEATGGPSRKRRWAWPCSTRRPVETSPERVPRARCSSSVTRSRPRCVSSRKPTRTTRTERREPGRGTSPETAQGRRRPKRPYVRVI